MLVVFTLCILVMCCYVWYRTFATSKASDLRRYRYLDPVAYDKAQLDKSEITDLANELRFRLPNDTQTRDDFERLVKELENPGLQQE